MRRRRTCRRVPRPLASNHSRRRRPSSTAASAASARAPVAGRAAASSLPLARAVPERPHHRIVDVGQRIVGVQRLRSRRRRIAIIPPAARPRSSRRPTRRSRASPCSPAPGSPTSPRIWRTPSSIRLKPCTYASDEAAARGQHRQRAAELDAAALGERPALAALAEAVVLETRDHERREGVVDLRAVHVLRLELASASRAAPRRRRDVVSIVRRVVVVREVDRVRSRGLRDGVHEHGLLPEVARALDAS